MLIYQNTMVPLFIYLLHYLYALLLCIAHPYICLHRVFHTSGTLRSSFSDFEIPQDINNVEWNAYLIQLQVLKLGQWCMGESLIQKQTLSLMLFH